MLKRTDLVSGDISLQEKVLSIRKVWEQRSGFGAEGVFSGETSLKNKIFRWMRLGIPQENSDVT